MASISETVQRLARQRTMLGASLGRFGADRLSDMVEFGTNPGDLRARTFAAGDLAAGAALVVVLHGCTQNAAGYDHGAGWSHLADDHGFALLFPEQQRANNPNLCFNWFMPGDARREQGEAMSIRQMIAAMVARHGIDPSRIYVTGLSAGGAMAAVMLATYPEVFAGGAVIAGLPYGTAWSVQDALGRMRGREMPGDADLTALARSASEHVGTWPTISVWHGDADGTVDRLNAEALVTQWRGLHGVDATALETEPGNGFWKRVWRDPGGREVVEDYLIAGMGHGTPLDTAGEDGCGVSGRYMLDVGLSSTRLLAKRWGLIRQVRSVSHSSASVPPPRAKSRVTPGALEPISPLLSDQIESTIATSLRAAGLLR